MKVKVAQLCPTLCDPTDYTVHGILQARILEWVAFPFSRGSSQPRDRIQVSCIAGRFFTGWATREARMLTQIRLVSTFFTSCSYHFVLVLVMVRTLTHYTHSCFHVHKIAVSMLYIRLPELIYLTNKSLYLLPLPHSPWKPQFYSLFLWVHCF